MMHSIKLKTNQNFHVMQPYTLLQQTTTSKVLSVVPHNIAVVTVIGQYRQNYSTKIKNIIKTIKKKSTIGYKCNYTLNNI